MNIRANLKDVLTALLENRSPETSLHSTIPLREEPQIPGSTPEPQVPGKDTEQKDSQT
jgi:hypothetical protein